MSLHAPNPMILKNPSSPHKTPPPLVAQAHTTGEVQDVEMKFLGLRKFFTTMSLASNYEPSIFTCIHSMEKVQPGWPQGLACPAASL